MELTNSSAASVSDILSGIPRMYFDANKLKNAWRIKKMEGYKKIKGIFGNTYYVKMTAEEMEAKRKIGVLCGVFFVPLVFVFVMALAAGVIK